MKTLRPWPSNSQNQQQSLKLFTKLREMKNRQQPIEGVPLVQSDCSDHEDEDQDISLIRSKLQQFKEQKAREVAARHQKTKESIENIVLAIKDELQYQALCIINPNIQDSVERREKPVKDLGSTLPGSTEKGPQKDTPGFDLISSKSKCKLVVDLREFTLGQKDQGFSSNRSQQHYFEHLSEVSEFNLPVREPSSRRIKEKIMNSNKTRNK